MKQLIDLESKKEILGLYEKFINIRHKINENKEDVEFRNRNIKTIIKNLDNNELEIAFIGGYSTGKSTIINALIGDCLLPAQIKPTTGYITKIKYSENPRLRFVDLENDNIMEFEGNIEEIKEKLRNHTVENISKEVNNFNEIEIGYPSEILKNGLVILDTPGADTTGAEIIKTNEVLERIFAAVYIFSAEKFYSEFDEDFIPKIREYTKKFLFVLNMIDSPNAANEEYKDTIAKIEKDLGDKGKLELIKVSGLKALYARSSEKFDDFEYEKLEKKYGTDLDKIERESNFKVFQEKLNKLGKDIYESGRITEPAKKLNDFCDSEINYLKDKSQNLDITIDKLNDDEKAIINKKKEYNYFYDDLIKKFKVDYKKQIDDFESYLENVIDTKINKILDELNNGVYRNQYDVDEKYKNLTPNLTEIFQKKFGEISDEIDGLITKYKRDCENQFDKILDINIKIDFKNLWSEPEKLNIGNKVFCLWGILGSTASRTVSGAKEQAKVKLDNYKIKVKKWLEKNCLEIKNNPFDSYAKFLKTIGEDRFKEIDNELADLKMIAGDKDAKIKLKKKIKENIEEIEQLKKKVEKFINIKGLKK